MKKTMIVIALILTATAFATDVGVKVDGTQDTTISIQKGKNNSLAKKYTISEGEHEVYGDKDVVGKSAEISWKAECKEWQKEFRIDNKDNKIISVSCGKMQCAKVGVETTCSSVGKYKIKTLTEE